MPEGRLTLPASVQVGHLHYRVETVSDESWRERFAGQCDRDRQVIKIATGMADGTTAETLLHEILHAAWAVGKCGPLGKREERAVNGLAPILLMVMRDNRALFASIVEAIETKGADT